MGPWRRIIDVSRRELRIWIRRPVYIAGSLTAIVFSVVFYLTLLGRGLPSDLPIGVVDYDNSSLTRNFIRQLDATQLGKVIRYDSFEAARADMQKGRITSVCVLPEHMYADVTAGRRPTFTFYVNSLYFVGGALAYKDILTMINLTGGAVSRENLRARGKNDREIQGLLRPIDIDTHQIGNTTTNYGIYLGNVILPGILEMLIVLVLVYSLGSELKYGTSRHLLRRSDGSVSVALAGKLLVYTLYFTIVGSSMVLLLYRWLHFPMAGSVWAMLLDMLMLVLASESVAVFIVGMIPVCRFAMSIGALYTVMGLSMAGFTMPVELMPPAIQGLAEIFPLRHYYLWFVQEAQFGAGFAGWWPELLHMVLFLLLPFPVLVRLKKAYIYQNYPKN